MLIAGLILLVIAALLATVVDRRLALIAAAIGLVLLVIGLFRLADDDARAAVPGALFVLGSLLPH